MNILHIDSSILGGNSVSRQLSAALVARLTALHPEASVVYRDVVAPELPQLSPALLAYKMSLPKDGSAPEPAVTAEGKRVEADFALTARVLEEFLAADVVVVGSPMYNLTVPVQLKCWIDCINVAGKTFRYTREGPIGLCGGKRVLIASARGGVYTVSPMQTFDHQETLLARTFGFFGITDVEVIRAEGVAVSPELRQSAVSTALAGIAALVR